MSTSLNELHAAIMNIDCGHGSRNYKEGCKWARHAAAELVANAAPVSDADGLYEAIKHGDAAHQAWLKDAIVAFFAGQPIPQQVPPVQTAVAVPDCQALKAWLSNLETEVGLSCNSEAMRLFTKVRTYLQQEGHLAAHPQEPKL